MALPKENRLKKRKDFALLKNSGRPENRRFFGFLALKNQPNRSPLFGFVISKKISPKAVERNRIRRCLAQSVRPFVRQLKPGLKIIFLAKKNLLKAETKTIDEEVKKVLAPFLK